jgi:hypothetical protein
VVVITVVGVLRHLMCWQSGLGVMAVNDQEWFAAFPDRRLRMREATPEEAGPARPGSRILAIVARGRAPFVFQAGRDFVRLDNDREIATLLSQMEKRFGAAN